MPLAHKGELTTLRRRPCHEIPLYLCFGLGDLHNDMDVYRNSAPGSCLGGVQHELQL